MAETTAAGAAAGATVTQADLVKESFGRLGRDAAPAAVRADVKQKHGVDVRRKYISALKAELFGKGAATAPAKKPAAKKPQAPKARAGAARVTPRPAAKPATAVGSPAPRAEGVSVRLEDLAALRDLVRRVGADKLRTLIAFLEG